MRTNLCVLFLLLATLFPAAYGKSRRSSDKPVQVDGNYRKDGTYVHAHRRSLPGQGDHGTTYTEPAQTYHPPRESHSTTHPRSYRSGYMAQGYAPTRPSSVTRTAGSSGAQRPRTPSSITIPAPRRDETPAPAPATWIDHVKPLECGGADAPFNMQWQTIAVGKAKDKTERYCR